MGPALLNLNLFFAEFRASPRRETLFCSHFQPYGCVELQLFHPNRIPNAK